MYAITIIRRVDELRPHGGCKMTETGSNMPGLFDLEAAEGVMRCTGLNFCWGLC